MNTGHQAIDLKLGSANRLNSSMAAQSSARRIGNACLRPFKQVAKCMIKVAVETRLRNLPVSANAAERWAERIKRWPAILSDDITRCVTLDHDLQLEVGLVDVIERNLWVHQAWDPTVKGVLESLLTPGDHFLDMGANIGYFTLLASRLVGDSGTVVAIEPSLRALRKLTRNVWANGCTNVFVASCAAGEQWRQDRLCLVSESNIGASAIAGRDTATSRFERVWMAPVDQLLQGIDLRPKLIKLDMEGYELSGLRGASNLIDASRPWIVCEVTDKFLQRYDASCRELVSFLSQRGYVPVPAASISTGLRRLDPAAFDDPTLQMDVVFAPEEFIPNSLTS